MDKASRIYVAGGDSLVGRAIRERLDALGFTAVIAAREPDLRDRADVRGFFERVRPEYVFVTAGRTAGIEGNRRAPAELMLDNLLVAAHVIPAAWDYRVSKLLYLTSSCTYPRLAEQPLRVSSLWNGPLEPTSAPYAVSKLAGMTLGEAYRRQHGARFITCISADVYGPGDDFSENDSHVVAALIRRIHDAKRSAAPRVAIWGTGAPKREFIHADDAADACLFAMRFYDDPAPLNLGTGASTSIAELAALVATVVGYPGSLEYDATKPDGMPFKGLDSTPLHDLGWRPRVGLTEGLRSTYEWFARQPALHP